MTNSSRLQRRVNQTNLFSSNDKIKRDICDPGTLAIQENPRTSFQSCTNELESVVIVDVEVQMVVQNARDTVARQSATIGTCPAEPFAITYGTQNSNDLSGQLPDQFPQQSSSVRLSQSLEFVHDVHPYQKTQHSTKESEECVNKYSSPYTMRIQGVKTDADKGKSILPQIKVSLNCRNVV